MANGPRYKMAFRRRREGRTNYHKRRKLLRAKLPRAVVRRSDRHIQIQMVAYAAVGDEVLITAHSRELIKMGWKHPTSNLPAAYLTGYLSGKKAMTAGIDEAVLDIGLEEPIGGSVMFAALKGLLDAGVWIPHSEEILPPKERLMGNHIDERIEGSVDELIAKMEAD